MLLSQRTIDKVVAKKKVFPQGEVRLLKANERAAPKQRSFQRHGVFLLAVMCSQLFSLRFTGVIYMGCVKEFAVPSFFSECWVLSAIFVQLSDYFNCLRNVTCLDTSKEAYSLENHWTIARNYYWDISCFISEQVFVCIYLFLLKGQTRELETMWMYLPKNNKNQRKYEDKRGLCSITIFVYLNSVF